MEKAFEDLSKGEQEDFLRSCKQYGWRPADLKVTFFEQFPTGPQPGPIGRQVRVTNLLNNVVKQYAAGNGTSWTYEFELDLQRGQFGRL